MRCKASQYKGQGLIALGAVIWGTQGPFAQFLMQSGASPIFVAIMKLFVGSMALMLFMLLTSPEQLKIDKQGLLLTGVIGLVSQAGFNYLYYNSVKLIGIANAAVILYTSPIFFLVLSVVFFNEKLTFRKTLAAIICFIGCAVAVTGGQLDLSGFSMLGLLMALVASLTFAIMGAIGKKALAGYAPLTIIAYSFLWGALFLLPSALTSSAFDLIWQGRITFGVLGIGILPAALAYFLYFTGVNEGVPLSQAGVISALEMVSAVIIAWTIFGEPVNGIKVVGVLFILLSVCLTGKGDVEGIPQVERDVV